ncbi:hypothetical protein [Arcobacter sp. F2176]|uniref:hypothetical protein n=1 Tax=Arcobacter sp. F2176 TaxID=2044511 RepID=UPI00100B79B5|nr:hypothetical protein [Arcobacter sp. F2176]RXJ79359.1 hypothetical protein CRU95_14570 [Arcobacter sp. F2176]
MKNILKVSSILFLALFFLAGCRTASIYNVNNDPIEVKASMDKVYNAIKFAGASKGWIITKVKPGLAMGKLNVRKHQAVVEIPYTEKSFSINYKSSLNLKYNSQTNQIHQNYNGWIQNLENAINLQLSMLQK